MRGADVLIESLVEREVKHIYTLSGNHIMPVFDAAIDSDIELIHTRHEAAAVHMADAWGRLTKQPGVALVTAGPGHANTLSALYGAHMAESPMVLLSGHAPLDRLTMGAFQEMDQVGLATSLTKAAWLVKDGTLLEEDIAHAFEIARSGKPGPVHLSIPSDILAGEIDQAKATDASPRTRNQLELKELSQPQIDEILLRLSTAANPLVLTGPAMSRFDNWTSISHFSSVTTIPVLKICSPRGVNDPGLHFASTIFPEVDVVVLIGKNLDFTLRFGEAPCFREDCCFIQIDPNESTLLQADDRIEQIYYGDPRTIIKQLTSVAKTMVWHNDVWYERVRQKQQAVPDAWSALRQSDNCPIHPLRVCEAVQPYLDKGAIFVSDGGEFGQWIQAGLAAETSLINGPAGSIGSALPLALGAKTACPEKLVFALMGDGTFGFHSMEMDTALRYNLPIVVIVGNDARWNAEVQIQIRNYGSSRAVDCELLPTKYDQVTKALGGHGEYVHQPNDLASALARSVDSGLPACINVMIDGVGAPVFS